MTRPTQVALSVFLAISVAIAGNQTALSAPPPATKPIEGLRDNTPEVYALSGARIVKSPGDVIEQGVMVVRDGVIEAVSAAAAIPPDARTIDLAGKTIYPGLIDAYSEVSVSTDHLQRGAPYWNEDVRPQLNVAENYRSDGSLNEKLRQQGFAARLAAPAGGIIKGKSALVATGDASNERAIIRDDVALHVRLTVSRGRSRRQYPNSPMGAVALARQAMLDAQWYDQAWRVARSDLSLPRPERNDALEALAPYAGAESLVLVDASNELFFLRADQFAREFALSIAIVGSGNEYRRLDAIRDTGRAVILPLDFPQPPNVGTAEAAANVTLEQLLHWDLAPENPARLHAGGVRIALTTRGLDDVGEFLKQARIAVERGLPPDVALRAMTVTPAAMFGVSDRLGSIETGKAASFFVTDGDLFTAKTKVLETWVDGRRYEHAPESSIDVRGRWRIEASADGSVEKYIVELTGKADKLSGSIRRDEPGDDEERGDADEARNGDDEDEESKDDEATKLDHVALRDARLSCTFKSNPFGRDGVARLTAVVSAPSDGEMAWTGHIVWPDGGRAALIAARSGNVDDERDGDEGGKNNADEEPDDDQQDDSEKKKTLPASFAVNYPLGAFGRAERPAQPQQVLITGATIWTCGPEGVLENASILLGDGKVIAVGSEIPTPEGAVVIDASGKHITPGIIDCHSHMATDGGVNESTQAITAEVRIGDFIDADDISIYRQIAGGATAANILHGSANPIGGQNQVIKLRWGAVPEEMKFAEAPQGIKFALGENVKQSNWGDDYTSRYPQTRMGVEQIMLDAFHAARAYRQQHKEWERTRKGLPPRRDLELEALAEIVEGSRWIHCHSYRQDEILALIRTLESFDIQIGTFQHILEGYKVADEMARHGAMGSAFSDWWAYKFEVYDAIPYNGALMHNAGVVVSFNSDDRELARHLNHEAGKAIKYGNVPEEEALKFVTLNPAKQLRIDQYVGSLEPGKHADLAVWSRSPMSPYSRCEQTWIDGRKYFDLADDVELRTAAGEMRNTLVQKILTSGEKMREPGERHSSDDELWPREDIFCHRHGHGGSVGGR